MGDCILGGMVQELFLRNGHQSIAPENTEDLVKDS